MVLNYHSDHFHNLTSLVLTLRRYVSPVGKHGGKNLASGYLTFACKLQALYFWEFRPFKTYPFSPLGADIKTNEFFLTFMLNQIVDKINNLSIVLE